MYPWLLDDKVRMTINNLRHEMVSLSWIRCGIQITLALVLGDHLSAYTTDVHLRTAAEQFDRVKGCYAFMYKNKLAI